MSFSRRTVPPRQRGTWSGVQPAVAAGPSPGAGWPAAAATAGDARSRATRKDPALTGSARRQPRGAGASRRRACGFLAAMALLQRGNAFLGLADAGEQDGVPGFHGALADQVIDLEQIGRAHV